MQLMIALPMFASLCLLTLTLYDVRAAVYMYTQRNTTYCIPINPLAFMVRVPQPPSGVIICAQNCLAQLSCFFQVNSDTKACTCFAYPAADLSLIANGDTSKNQGYSWTHRCPRTDFQFEGIYYFIGRELVNSTITSHRCLLKGGRLAVLNSIAAQENAIQYVFNHATEWISGGSTHVVGSDLHVQMHVSGIKPKKTKRKYEGWFSRIEKFELKEMDNTWGGEMDFGPGEEYLTIGVQYLMEAGQTMYNATYIYHGYNDLVELPFFYLCECLDGVEL